MRTNNLKWALLACLVAAWGFAACGDNNSNPTPVTSSSSTTSTTSSTGSSTSTTSSGMGGASSSSTGSSTSGMGGAGGAGGGGNCFKGTPKTEAEFLNQCTSADCAQYDNTKLKLLNPDGSLPPLP